MPKTRWCRELERQWPHRSLLTEEQVRSGPEHLRSGPPSRAHGAGQRRGLTLRWGSLGTWEDACRWGGALGPGAAHPNSRDQNAEGEGRGLCWARVGRTGEALPGGGPLSAQASSAGVNSTRRPPGLGRAPSPRAHPPAPRLAAWLCALEQTPSL